MSMTVFGGRRTKRIKQARRSRRMRIGGSRGARRSRSGRKGTRRSRSGRKGARRSRNKRGSGYFDSKEKKFFDKMNEAIKLLNDQNVPFKNTSATQRQTPFLTKMIEIDNLISRQGRSAKWDENSKPEMKNKIQELENMLNNKSDELQGYESANYIRGMPRSWRLRTDLNRS